MLKHMESNEMQGSFPTIPANTTWEPPTLKYFKWTYKALDGQTPAYRATETLSLQLTF